jgi:hypothetical protein
MAEIFSSLAAFELGDLVRMKDMSASRGQDVDMKAERVVEYLSRADGHTRVNEYSWLIKGFYELRQGMMGGLNRISVNT